MINTDQSKLNANDIYTFLKTVPPLDRLPESELRSLLGKLKPLRFRMGQKMQLKTHLPTHWVVIFTGKVRLVGIDPGANRPPLSLGILGSGEILGWPSLVRQIPCETAVASEETVGFVLPAEELQRLYQQYPEVMAVFDRPSIAEVYDLITCYWQRINQALPSESDLYQIVRSAWQSALVSRQYSPDDHRVWFDSCASADELGRPLNHAPLGQISRLVGINGDLLEIAEASAEAEDSGILDMTPTALLDYAPEMDFQITSTSLDLPQTEIKVERGANGYPFVRGQGLRDGILACFQMLSMYLNIKYRRDTVQRIVDLQLSRNGQASLQLCGAIADVLGLMGRLREIPASQIARINHPALIPWQNSYAVVYRATEQQVVLGIPEEGVRKLHFNEFIKLMGDPRAPLQILILQETKNIQREKFGLSWFLPYVAPETKVLLEVLVASFFVQLFGLANPLLIQVIIDRVLINNSPSSLQFFALLLISVALFENILTSIRSIAFANATNRIDLALAAKIIDHLFHLPLSYFDRRAVGELSTRVAELDRIRQFFTNTALTTILDAAFSLLYIVVMLFYSPFLTVVALSTVPLFVLLSFTVSPIVRRQLRTKAELNAQSQSYLVEALGGVYTVKAQNMERRSRNQWQSFYDRYIAASFNTTLTYTMASSTSNFLNQLSSLLVLWAGAQLVLENKLTLGGLIAFRIIAGYVTGPLLRLLTIWQNFQETALSIERLSDVVDSPLEVEEDNRFNVPMPMIRGKVVYEDIMFQFGGQGRPQLNRINLEFHTGDFIGIVGQSGSGKSTLMKLLPRLYTPTQGRILIDSYDINKVELYSLRSQIGIVSQEPLLFDGTVQDNIAINYPDATAEEIIQAARIAVAHDFIMSLPNGYNTRVGERGSSLSGGQKQRIALARTVLQRPRMLILDEATSALDYDTERQVCNNLVNNFQGITIFCITHRLRTIQTADKIVVMDRGLVAEQGSHQELLARRGIYYCLSNDQETSVTSMPGVGQDSRNGNGAA
jgi:ATP-binding cassette, subfamily B, bacterial HlyB/CyaB